MVWSKEGEAPKPEKTFLNWTSSFLEDSSGLSPLFLPGLKSENSEKKAKEKEPFNCKSFEIVALI